MQTYKIGMIPGPSGVDEKISAAYLTDYASPDLELEFLELYGTCEENLKRLLSTDNTVAIQSGEGMLALWGALKSVQNNSRAQRPRLLCIAAGVFGHGFADMGACLGYDVSIVEAPYDSVVNPQDVRRDVAAHRPNIVTTVHCETPSGILVPSEYMEEYGRIAQEAGALFCVDFVSSAAGAFVPVDKWGIDLGLLGSQKCLGLAPDLCFTSVSARAWEVIKKVNYCGYDALAPFFELSKTGEFPYTHNWRALKALDTALNLFFAEGAQNVYARHEKAAKVCQEGLKTLGIKLFPADEKIYSPTVTAAYVPQDITWENFDKKLRLCGLGVGGSYGKLQNKVFRLGHMGSQANVAKVNEALNIIKEAITKK